MNSREEYGRGRQLVEDLPRRLVADAKLFLVDQRVVDAVDHEFAELAVADAALELVAGDVVAEAEGFEEVLVDDVGAGGDDGVHHVVADHVDEDLLQPRGDQRAGQAEDDAALIVAEHPVVDVGGAGGIARSVGHRGHRVDERDDVVGGDINVADRGGEELFFSWHGRVPVYRDAGCARRGRV